MRVEPIKNGMVIDHIAAGRAMQIYYKLSLDKLNCPVAIIKNVPSKKMGRKDIIKIDCDMTVDLDVLGYLSPNSTVAIVRDGVIVSKEHIGLPDALTDILKCHNPRCITSTEQGIHHRFRLADADRGVYRCIYCDAKSE